METLPDVNALDEFAAHGEPVDEFVAAPGEPEADPPVAEVAPAEDAPLARATVHLPGGIVPGLVLPVNLSSPYVQWCLEARFLVLVETPTSAPAVEAADDS